LEQAAHYEAVIQAREEAMTMAAVRRDNSVSLFAVPAIIAERRSDGSTIVRSTTPLKPAARCIGDWLEHWARTAPDRIFLGERTGDVPWTTVTYREALKQVRSIAAWALARAERRPSACRSFRQQRRSRAARAWRHACRRARCGDLAGLFAGVQGF
jgi:hypothetical protein